MNQMQKNNEAYAAVENWKLEKGKAETIQKKWGNKTPDYLFYAIPRGSSFNLDVLRNIFGLSPNSHWTNMEVHKSSLDEVEDFLRIRTATKLVLSANIPDVKTGKPVKAILYQAGHADDVERCVRFLKFN